VSRGDSSVSPLGFPKAYADSAPILVNEFHAGGFEALPHNLKRCATGLVCAGLQLTNGHDTDPGFVCEFLLTPIEQTTGSSALRRRNHQPGMA
jgi:hypothetical protein